MKPQKFAAQLLREHLSFVVIVLSTPSEYYTARSWWTALQARWFLQKCDAPRALKRNYVPFRSAEAQLRTFPER
ncbi:MAG: hypothetical protein EAZ90_17625 [Oscillatoriales cyanobacterium]|nr:MAG: hypothetical protein EAZ94_22230 [Oscillatoriales cyanobacterium]TAE18743.1 MAG: hypothetical protein EAZ93_28835 [Oscillatoriales cyanobacterium]TAE41631.1 MAG: hypothetical protein EAZ90_17625 [Oscillatoriales cyanobacterium]TAE51033.1 MAG: hypothetical protein EAZ88_19130 [Oscillatoriales cyanobacterium]TAE66231.1 MAG: hypothetical protein EAZ86_21355 [Oscillatoriales cyanobacterium]